MPCQVENVDINSIDILKVLSIKVKSKGRLLEVVHGVEPQTHPRRLDSFPHYIDINQFSINSRMDAIDGRSAHLLHTWDGTEGQVELASVCWSPETKWFYEQQRKKLSKIFGGYNQKRDIAMVNAIRSTLPNREIDESEN